MGGYADECRDGAIMKRDMTSIWFVEPGDAGARSVRVPTPGRIFDPERAALENRLTSATCRIQQLENERAEIRGTLGLPDDPLAPDTTDAVKSLRKKYTDTVRYIGSSGDPYTLLINAGIAMSCIERDNKTMLENLTATQKRCTELLDECRGWRRIHDINEDHRHLLRALGSIVAERYRQDIRWGAVGPNFLDRKDLEHDSHPQTRKDVADYHRSRCDNAAKNGTLTWEHILAEEWAEACAETDPEKLRTELVQVAAVAASWIQAIDMRAELENERIAERSAQGSLDRIAAIRTGVS